MSGNVGGDPAAMTGGAKSLHGAGGKIEEAGRGLAHAVAQASGSAGYADLAGALRRLGAATGTAIEDLGTQTKIGAALAEAAAQDVVAASGGH
ncbi:hypothetical protein [Nocardioides sp. CER19]|uniref:hypothetical protein n=1 Tax=Nocardioides sp. CER19 TaxID=3038538 RepID=UPI00244A22D1|nr:hypothetical protein [Nocardioides sp. CER19]MDH2414582.1 hypothetical protein [Nocardioides sp. CER19]